MAVLRVSCDLLMEVRVWILLQPTDGGTGLDPLVTY